VIGAVQRGQHVRLRRGDHWLEVAVGEFVGRRQVLLIRVELRAELGDRGHAVLREHGVVPRFSLFRGYDATGPGSVADLAPALPPC
jgi:hypothetical protein